MGETTEVLKDGRIKGISTFPLTVDTFQFFTVSFHKITSLLVLLLSRERFRIRFVG